MRIENFDGLAPGLNGTKNALLGYAEVAHNCDLSRGGIYPWGVLSTAAAVSAYDPTHQTIVRVNDKYISFKDGSACRSPLANDSWERVYHSPKDGGLYCWYNVAPGVNSVTTDTSNYERLGIDPPNKLTVNTARPTIDPPVGESATYTYYIATLVNQYGEEGAPSDPSVEIELYSDTTVTITSPTFPSDRPLLNAWRIYKVLDGQWVFVAEVPKGTLEYRDTLDAPTGEALMSGEWFPPPVDLRGVSLSPGGFLTGYSGRNVHFSEQFLPHAWPPSYSLTCRYDIRGVVATANGVIIVTTGRPYIALGGTPSAMQLRDIESDYGCVSAESVVDMGEFAVYAASVGLIAIDTNGNATNLTESIINYRQWGAMSPSSIKAVRMQHLYLFKANGVWYAFDMKSGKLTTADVSDLPPTAVYDTEWGELLHLSSGKLVRTKIQATGFTWQSKPVVSQKRERFAWVQVEAESYPVQVTVTYPNPNGDLTHTHIAENGLPARLAPHMGDTFYVTVESNAAVYAVVLTNDLRELAQ